MLLSSLEGAAITSIYIDGVLHEFSSIPGVREDVIDIVLNVKHLALRMHGEGVKRMVLKSAARARHRRPDPATGDIEIMNPNWSSAPSMKARTAGSNSR